MADKRMFTMRIVDSDAFLDMPLSTQALYFHLNMRADDDGFINNPKKIKKVIDASDDDLRLLISKRFVIGFDNGVIAIKHWRMHNTIKKDRYKPTQYQDQLAMLTVKDNNSYTEKTYGTTLEPERNHFGTTLEPQYSIEEYSVDKCSVVESEFAKKNELTPTSTKKSYGEFDNVFLSDSELQKLKSEHSDYQERIESLSAYIESTGKSYKSHYATIKRWAKADNSNGQNKNQCTKSNFQDRNITPAEIEAFERMELNRRIEKDKLKEE